MLAKNAFFLKSTVRDRVVMRICVGANFLLIVFCLVWLEVNWQKTAPSSIVIALVLLAGYYFSDIASGIIHWTADTWFYEAKVGRALSILREHHSHPLHVLEYGWLEHASLGSAPSVLIVAPLAFCISQLPHSASTFIGMLLCLELAICLFFLSFFHNLGHCYSRFKAIRFAQEHRFLMSPRYHAVHHRSQTIRYCAINGWANYLFDRYLIWRRLESMIQSRTGAVPRDDDEAWQKLYRRQRP